MAPERYSEQQDVGELKQDDPFLLFFKQNAKALIGAALIFQCCFLGFICFLTATSAELDAALLFLSLLAKAVFLTLLLYAMGWFVENKGWKVAYTRKVIHVAFFAVPFWFDAHMVSLFFCLSIRAIRLTSSVLCTASVGRARHRVGAVEREFGGLDLDSHHQTRATERFIRPDDVRFLRQARRQR